MSWGGGFIPFLYKVFFGDDEDEDEQKENKGPTAKDSPNVNRPPEKIPKPEGEITTYAVETDENGNPIEIGKPEDEPYEVDQYGFPIYYRTNNSVFVPSESKKQTLKQEEIRNWTMLGIGLFLTYKFFSKN